MTDLTDPRVQEYRQARQAVEAGLSAPLGTRKRYEAAVVRYVKCMADITPDIPLVRRAMMCALHEDARLPLNVILDAYGATDEEAEYVERHHHEQTGRAV